MTNIARVSAIAADTVRGLLRDRVLHAIVLLAAVVIALAWLLGGVTFHEEERLARDLGLAAIALAGVVLATVLGARVVHRDVERRAVDLLLTRPLTRGELLVGRFLGCALVMLLAVTILGGAVALTLRSAGGVFDGAMLRACLLLWVEELIVLALALLFSTFTTPLLASLYTLGLWAVGRSLPELRGLAGGNFVTRSLLHIVPDTHLYFPSGSALDGRAVSVNGARFVDWSYVAWAGGYGALYVAAALCVAVTIFARRDLA